MNNKSILYYWKFSIIIASGILAMLISCKQSSQSENIKENYFVYVSHQDEDSVAIYAMDPSNGNLEKIHSVGIDGSPACLALHPSKNFIFVAQRSAQTISSYRIDHNSGDLEYLNTIDSFNPVYISTDKTGNYLLAAFNQPQPDLDDQMKAAIYRIDDDGSLVSGSIQEIVTGLKPHSILTDNSNNFMYIPCTDAAMIMQFRFEEETGTALPMDPPATVTPPGEGPRHFDFHGEKNIVYFVNETNGTITAYNIDPETGALEPFQNISTLPEGFNGNVISADIHITPDNNFLYATNRRDENSIAAYSIDHGTGKLSLIGIYPTEKMPREFDIDPTGQFLYAAGEASDSLACYKINPENGELKHLRSFYTGDRPTWVLTVKFKGSS